MRVRPFFWFLLVFSCTSVLIFAATRQTYAPAVMQVHIPQQPTSVKLTMLDLRLTDPQGLPIDEAQVFSTARMTNMYMVTKQSSVSKLEAGNYVAQIHLYMAGRWEITVIAHADGFASLRQTFLVQVV